jgi:hypothetical protein
MKTLMISIVAVSATTAWATTVHLSPTDDAMIFDDGSGSDSLNASGKGPGMFAGADGNTRKKRALVKFDTSGITAMTSLTSVELDLVIGQIAGSGGMGCGMSCNPPSRTFSFYQVDYTTTWIEGNTGLTACGTVGHPNTIRCAAMSGTGQGWPYYVANGCAGSGSGASCGNDVSWQYINADTPSSWHHASGSPQDQDYGSGSFGNPTYGNGTAVASYTFSSFTIGNTMVFSSDSMNQPGFLSMVQDWVDHPTHNNGMEIRAASLETTTQSFIGWWTHDGDDMNPGSTGPVLTINY